MGKNVKAPAQGDSPGKSAKPASSVSEGHIISHYRVVKQLGKGGMGEVYEAEDIRLGRRVALKFLPESLASDSRTLRRFEREARAASSLNHPNICTIYEVEEYRQQPVIVMELLDGQNFKERIRVGKMGPDEITEAGIQIADALEVAHRKGIVHRDIKPANLFIINGGQVKILDFGVAKVMRREILEEEVEEDTALTLDGVIPGTTAYMSPEQVRAEELDGRSDLFSLGVVLYEMSTGERPFTGKNRVVLMDKILNAKVASPSEVNPAVPEQLSAIVLRCLEKNRESRYQQGAEIVSDLKRLRAVTEPAAAGAFVAPAIGSSTRSRSHWKIAALIAVALLGLAGGMFWWTHRSRALTEKDTIVLAEFLNSTGDAVFDGTLRRGLTIQLEQSPFLSLISDSRIQQTLRLMGQQADAPLTPDIAGELCERTSSGAVIDGSISSLGSQYIVGLRAKACRTGDVLAEEQVQAARKEDVLTALSKAAARLRRRLGESLTTVEKHDIPLEMATLLRSKR